MSATLIGVGVGPGDPELLTLRAVRVLQHADRVVAPSIAPDVEGRAESIVRQAVPGLRVDRVLFEMAAGAPTRRATARRVAATIDEWFASTPRIAFVTLGDPNVYSTFSAVAWELRHLRPALEVTTVPGIMAFQDLAARAGTVLLDDVESLTLVSALTGPEAAVEALRDPARAVVVYRGGRHLPAIAKALSDAGRLEGAVVGELLGLPGERIGPVSDLSSSPLSYLATVVVPPLGAQAAGSR